MTISPKFTKARLSSKRYYHVFCREKAPGSKWMHQCSADTFTDSQAEVYSLRNQGYKTNVLHNSRTDVLQMVREMNNES